jgi:hypothetical protein
LRKEDAMNGSGKRVAIFGSLVAVTVLGWQAMGAAAGSRSAAKSQASVVAPSSDAAPVYYAEADPEPGEERTLPGHFELILQPD